MLLTYVHDVNANTEDKNKYLTDVVQVIMDKVTEMVDDGSGGQVEEIKGYLVKATPAVITGYEDKQVTPVHPKTEVVTKSMPIYTVPEKLNRHVRVPISERKQETANEQVMNWKLEEVVVTPIIMKEFGDEVSAQKYYEAVIEHLHEGTDIRTISIGTVRDSYSNHNSRYPSF